MTYPRIIKTVWVLGALAGTSLVPLTALGQATASSGVLAQTDLTNQRLATLDRDNDGLPNVIEKRAGTNPNNRDTNMNGVWDSDETIPGAGITYGEAYARGYYYDDDESEDGHDGDDDDSSNGGGANTIKRPVLPKLTCTRPNQRNCKPLTCKAMSKLTAKATAKKKFKRLFAKTCKPTKKKSPKATPKATTRPTPGAPTPKPTLKPTPNPTPAPPAQTGNFDSNGNTTKFGIPAGLTGNITAGSAIQSSSCNGCHGEKLSRSFAQLRGSLSIGAMSYIRLSDAQIANLTAYLNRSNK